MSEGRRRDEWERTARLMSCIAAKFAGERIDPESLNPVPDLKPDPPAGSDEAEAAEGWSNLRAGLAAWAEQNYGSRRN